jgi:pilus assembly protein Flp/PilA
MWNDFSQFLHALVLRVALRDEEGQGLVEYALILSLVSIATIAILTAIGGKIGVVFSAVTGAL